MYPDHFDMHGDETSEPITDADRPIPFFLTDAPVPFIPIEERCSEVPPSRGEVP